MRFEHTEGAVALIGLDGFRLLAAVEVDGELHQLVETTTEVVGCPGCGTRSLSKQKGIGLNSSAPSPGWPSLAC